MKRISKLESGKTYSLRQIFSKNFVIAIPDLQRDYCWGLETYDNKGKQQGELVSGFLASLKNNMEETSNSKAYTPMGLIYGYEWPKGTYQLCDGQQRITTLYLLTGELYRSSLVDETVKETLLAILSKQSKGADVVISALQYSIRETTLYFLSDLVSNYFLSNDFSLPFYNLEEREKNHLVLKEKGRPGWYFLEYDNDPTIQSMLGAIYTIQKFLKDSFSDSNSISSFAEAIVNRFSFIYYDMGNRMRGEETFVILNTTGEPLTSTENLKPLLIASLPADKDNQEFIKEISTQWEDREDWFWKHKADKELTSDELSRDFYTWWLVCYGDKESVNLTKDYLALDLRTCIKEIHSFYESLIAVMTWLYDSYDAKSIFSKISEWTSYSIDCSTVPTILTWLRSSSHRELILPLLSYHTKFGKEDILPMLRRLAKNYYIGKTTEGKDDLNNLRPYIKFRDIINIIKQSETTSQVLKNTLWYNFDEQRKEVVFNGREKELLEIELDDNIRFDLNVLWKFGVQTLENAKFAKNRLTELHYLSDGCIENLKDDMNAVPMSNKYRLIRFLKRWGAPNGKQNNVNWKQWGAWFTWDRYSDNLDKAYDDADFGMLLMSMDLNAEIDYLLKKLIIESNYSENIFSDKGLSHPEGIMRAWLISKFLLNNTGENNNLITTYGRDDNEYSLCINKEAIDENKVNKSLPMTIGNVCLHHCKRTGPWTVQIPNYGKSTCLDSPLFAGIYNVDYKEFVAGTVPEEIINKTTNHIHQLFEEYIEQTN